MTEIFVEFFFFSPNLHEDFFDKKSVTMFYLLRFSNGYFRYRQLNLIFAVTLLSLLLLNSNHLLNQTMETNL